MCNLFIEIYIMSLSTLNMPPAFLTIHRIKAVLDTCEEKTLPYSLFLILSRYLIEPTIKNY